MFYHQYSKICSLCRKLRKVSFSYIYGILITFVQRWRDRFKWNDLNRLYPEDWFAQRKSGDWNSDIRTFCQVIYDSIAPDSVADVGCGTGVYLQIYSEIGAKLIFGLEGADNAIKQAVVPVIEKHDLRLPFQAKDSFELVLCLEVAEHIHDIYADTLVKTIVGLCQHGGTIIFTAAVPRQGGFHHINLKPRQYWIDKFNAVGCQYKENLTEDVRRQLQLKVLPWLKANLMVFINHPS